MQLSVVVPVYNVEKYLKQCIDSILNQTEAVYEIILVDDGSTDCSGKICDSYAEQYKKIKVIHKKNAGLGMARNTGLETVTGEYVTFIDSDDFYDETYIQTITLIMDKTGCDTCKTSFKRVNLEGIFVSNESIVNGEYRGEQIRTELIPRLIGSSPNKKDSIPMSVCCTVYSMRIIREYGLQFVSEREWISEDFFFNIEYYSYSNYSILSDYVGYNYRINTNSLTTRYLVERFEKCLAMYNKEIEILMEMDFYDTCKFRLDRQFFIYLRMCFAQLKNSQLSKREIKNEISRICYDVNVQRIISEYPIGQLGFAQKIFLYFIKFRAVLVLYIYFCVR